MYCLSCTWLYGRREPPRVRSIPAFRELEPAIKETEAKEFKNLIPAFRLLQIFRAWFAIFLGSY